MAVPAGDSSTDSATRQPPVVCVDLDGTLVATDTAVENLLLFVRRFPLRVLELPLWLARGKAYLKHRLSKAAEIPVERLPYRATVIEWLRERKSEGSSIVLATGADVRIASRVAAHLGLFDEVHASDGETNLVGRRKAGFLRERYGRFLYVGDSRVDLPVWEAAENAVVFGSRNLRDLVARSGKPALLLQAQPGQPLWNSWLRAIRVHHWSKNVLVFLPLFTSHRIAEGPLLRQALAAFFGFSFAASAAYLLNDLLDLPADRAHKGNTNRPFASGALPITAAPAAIALLLILAALCSLWLPPAAGTILAMYFVLTLGYSFSWKSIPALDAVLLACFYLMRILFGGVVTGIRISIWLLAFSLFLFLSLALMKRLTELRSGKAGQSTETYRGYRPTDAGLLAALAGASGYLSVLLLALYINSPEAALLYRKPAFLWVVCLVLVFWVSRTALLSNRGELHTDPVVFAFTDRASLACGAAAALLVYLAA